MSFAAARRIVGNQHDAEDITQQTFLSVMDHLGDFREESSVATWILRIATNHALKPLRKRRGFDNVAGYLRDGMQALKPRPDLIQVVARITAPALAEQLAAPNGPFVLDVRAEKEWQAGHIAGGHNIPLTHLRERLAQVPTDRPVVVHCEGGYRSAIGCSLLKAAGRPNVSDLVGGIKAWVASKLPTESDGTASPSCTTAACTK